MTAATCTYFAALFLSYSSGLDCRNRLLNFPLPPKFPSIFFFLPSHLGFHFSAVSHKMSLFQNLFTHKSHSHKTKLQLSQNQVSAPLTPKSHSHKTKSHSYHTKLQLHLCHRCLVFSPSPLSSGSAPAQVQAQSSTSSSPSPFSPIDGSGSLIRIGFRSSFIFDQTHLYQVQFYRLFRFYG